MLKFLKHLSLGELRTKVILAFTRAYTPRSFRWCQMTIKRVKDSFCMFLAGCSKKPKKHVTVFILSYCLGRYCGEKSLVHAGCIICIFSLLPFVFSLPLLCFTFNLIYVHFKIFSSYHFEMDNQLSGTEHTSKIIYDSRQSLKSQILFRSQQRCYLNLSPMEIKQKPTGSWTP